MIKQVVHFVLILLVLAGCKESDPNVVNPYDSQVVEAGDDVVNPTDLHLDSTTIQGLHKFIFKPTCSNSGCHDGNFEPDFRTIESSYNSLVNQPIIKNDEMNPLTARVTPGNASTSMLIKRLTVDLNGNSGIMPLVTEPGSDWHVKKEEYIKRIETWINNGALNQNGKAPTSQNYPVQLVGVNTLINGNLANRNGFYEPMLVAAGTGQVEVWVAYTDDNLTNDQLLNAQLNFSLEANNFDSSNRINMQYVGSPLNSMGYLGVQEDHYFKAIIPTSSYLKNQVLWLRMYISDGVNSSELPNDNSLFRVKKYAAIKIQ